MKMAQATLGGGCFWCLEAIFSELEGVIKVQSGYSGGTTINPTYEQVCSGATGLAQVVQISFDPETISYADLLRVFFSIHDPTTLNRQGNDVGTQYRSVIFYHDEEQAQIARGIMEEVADNFDAPIVTELIPLDKFYPAEEYHRDYFARNPAQPYCAMVIAPKVAKFRRQYLDRLKKRS